MKLSVVISAYNEEAKIIDCLESVKFADEIIFIDNSSSDKTAQIAKKYTSKVFTVPNKLMLNSNKNFGFLKATGDFLLSLDADERILPELRKEIEEVLKNDYKEICGYWIPRKNIIFGQWIQNSIWWPDYQLRLFKRGKGKFEEKHVHEMLTVNGETRKLEHPMLHENYSSIAQFMYKMDKIYTENEAENIVASGKELHWSDALRMPASDFLKTFFMQKGYKDGMHGLALSMLQAFYAELVFLKVWERRGFKKVEKTNTFLNDVYTVAKKIGHEFQYWFLSVLIDESKNSVKKVYLKIKRKKEAEKVTE